MIRWQDCKASLLHFLYPSKCLHCHEQIPPHSFVMCDHCVTLLEPIRPEERCPTCFGLKKSESLNHCPYCVRHPSLYYRTASAFDYIGPASTLIKKFKYANQPHLARGIAAFLVAYFDQLDWPMPDALVPVPLSLSHWFERGYNQSALIAEEMAKLLNIPVWYALKRASGDFSQAGLTLEQRKKLGNKSFKLKGRYPLKGKTLLVIDDVLTSGATLAKCAETLMEGSPACLYALTVCKA